MPIEKQGLEYANEADLLNHVMFGCTAKQWQQENVKAHLEGKNIRDIASINELVVLANLENLNAILIKNNIDYIERYNILKKEKESQLKSLDKIDFIKSLKKTTNTTYLDANYTLNRTDELSSPNKKNINSNPKKSKK